VVQLKPGENVWRNIPLWAEHEAGRLVLVKRPSTKEGRSEDDLTIIKMGAYVCSNDLYRDHRRSKSLGFRMAGVSHEMSHFKSWVRANTVN
jgi:hypothetical protein